MEASIKNKKIYVMIYKKDNNLQTFLNINSEHPTSIKKKVFCTARASGIKIIYSTSKNFEHGTQEICKTRLQP